MHLGGGRATTTFETTSSSSSLQFSGNNYLTSGDLPLFLQAYKSASSKTVPKALTGYSTLSYTITYPKIKIEDILSTGTLFTKFSSNSTFLDLRDTEVLTSSYSKSTSSTFSNTSNTYTRTTFSRNFGAGLSSLTYHLDSNIRRITFRTTNYSSKTSVINSLPLVFDTYWSDQTRTTLYEQNVVNQRIIYSGTSFASGTFSCYAGYYEVTDPSKVTIVVYPNIAYRGTNLNSLMVSQTVTSFRATLSEA